MHRYLNNSLNNLSTYTLIILEPDKENNVNSSNLTKMSIDGHNRPSSVKSGESSISNQIQNQRQVAEHDDKSTATSSVSNLILNK